VARGRPSDDVDRRGMTIARDDLAARLRPLGLRVRGAVPADAADLAALIAAAAAAIGEEPQITRETVDHDLARADADRDNDVMVVLDGSVLVAGADCVADEDAAVVVRPADRGRGIGSALADWTRRRAGERASRERRRSPSSSPTQASRRTRSCARTAASPAISGGASRPPRARRRRRRSRPG